MSKTLEGTAALVTGGSRGAPSTSEGGRIIPIAAAVPFLASPAVGPIAGTAPGADGRFNA